MLMALASKEIVPLSGFALPKDSNDESDDAEILAGMIECASR